MLHILLLLNSKLFRLDVRHVRRAQVARYDGHGERRERRARRELEHGVRVRARIRDMEQHGVHNLDDHKRPTSVRTCHGRDCHTDREHHNDCDHNHEHQQHRGCRDGRIRLARHRELHEHHREPWSLAPCRKRSVFHTYTITVKQKVKNIESALKLQSAQEVI